MKAGEWFKLGPGVRGRIGVDGGVIVQVDAFQADQGGRWELMTRTTQTVALDRRELRALVLAWASVENRKLAGGER